MKLLTGFTSFVFAIYISTASISSYAQELIIEQSEGSSTGVVSPISRQQALSFSNRLAQLTDDFIEILLEDIGTDQVIRKNLSGEQLQRFQAILKKHLYVAIAIEDCKQISDMLIQNARNLGKSWKKKFTISQIFKSTSTSHGYVAEGLNYDDLLNRQLSDPSITKVGFTSPNSRSSDLYYMKGSNTVLVQTKAYKDGNTALKSLLFDAATAHADKNFRIAFEGYIPKDQFESLKTKGVIDNDGRIVGYEKRYFDSLSKEIKDKITKPSGIKKGTNAERLSQIPKKHGDIDEFTNRVMRRFRVKPLSMEYLEVHSLQERQILAHTRLLHKVAAYEYERIAPPGKKIANNAAAVTLLLSALTEVLSNDSAPDFESAVKIMSDSAKVYGATRIAEGVMRKIGNRVLFSTFFNTANMTDVEWKCLEKSMPARQIALLKSHTLGTMFLATIIFDEAGTIIDLCLANITGEEFAIETAENLIRAGGVTATCWGAIALGASPAGFVVMAAAIGGHILIGTAIDLIHTYNTRNLVSLNDFIGRLPTAISQRMSVFEGYHRSLIDDGGEGPFLPHSRTSIFEPKQRSVFDFDNN